MAKIKTNQDDHDLLIKTNESVEYIKMTLDEIKVTIENQNKNIFDTMDKEYVKQTIFLPVKSTVSNLKMLVYGLVALILGVVIYALVVSVIK